MQTRVDMSSKPISIYELETDDKRFLSPFCWAARFAIIHKGLKPDVIPWHFQEKDKIAFSNQGLVSHPFMEEPNLGCTSMELPNECLGTCTYIWRQGCKLCNRRDH